jgi:hypothetical protein
MDNTIAGNHIEGGDIGRPSGTLDRDELGTLSSDGLAASGL